jgi:hypothetical protein
MEEERAKPVASDRRLFDFVMGASVVLISVVSLFVAISANRTQERMLAASIWPSLLFNSSNAASDGRAHLSVDLLNRGTGPARLRWVELSWDDVALSDWRDLMRRCCAPEGTALEDVHAFTSGVQNRIIGADEWVPMLQLAPDGAPEAVWQALDRERFKLRLRTCYCSVLDDCWLFDSAEADPRPVSSCPTAPKVLWQG